MKTLTRNAVIHAVFEEMSKLLKEKEGIPNKAIAIDTGIDFGIFSKLLSGKKEISELYEHKIYNYFKQESFSKYEDHLKLKITKLLHLFPQSPFFQKIWKMSYENLLNFLFFEMDINDIHFEQQIKSKFLQLLHDKLYDLIQRHSPNLRWICSNISSSHTANMPIEIQLSTAEPKSHNIFIIIDSTNPKLPFNPLNESGNYYVHIRIDTSFLEHLYIVENIGFFDNQLITIETINVNQLHMESNQLALLIFDKICSAKDSFDISPKPIYTLNTLTNVLSNE